ncbi:MAG: hypothetical protein UV42_C0036G0027 [Candidatus Magasanikbacteria bacterium GW2011_GWE2_42_7]|uniref:Uncharacterized protein n=1 Tax=Candidatus Magasanikbacteria bacterium GW2011_GWE2_42_7 TaxID=1619052 RepID=A0A0G1DJW6_9BACT|nr:MAG: hypothetical protein UV42_C0036G0027 [Candidatus Magasanikbacteria bacterium GW2011_GWE2_42_7]
MLVYQIFVLVLAFVEASNFQFFCRGLLLTIYLKTVRLGRESGFTLFRGIPCDFQAYREGACHGTECSPHERSGSARPLQQGAGPPRRFPCPGRGSVPGQFPRPASRPGRDARRVQAVAYGKNHLRPASQFRGAGLSLFREKKF